MNVLRLSRFSLISAYLILLGCTPTKRENYVDVDKAARINTQLGLAYLKQSNRPRAKRKLLTALKQQPNSSQVNGALAYYFEETHELKQASAYYLKAIALAPNDGAALNNYGVFLCHQKKYAESTEYFLKAVKDDHYIHTAKAYENAGLCVANIPNLKKATYYFSKALEQDPSLKVSFHEWVKTEILLGNNKKAAEMLQNRPDLVLNDKKLVSLAKKLKITNSQLAYNSGATNEYNTNDR